MYYNTLRMARRSSYLVVIMLVLMSVCAYLTAQLNTENSLPIQRYDKNLTAFSEKYEEIPNDFEKNLEKLDKLSFPRSASWYSRLGFDTEPHEVYDRSLPVFVTGANKNYYMRSQALIKSIHQVMMPKYPNLKLIYYDLGLTSHQNYMVTKFCKCEVRKLDFENLPPHVTKLKNYSFKPIIMKRLYQEFGYVWWMDSAFRFLSPNIDTDLQFQQQNNIWFYDDAPCNNYTMVSRTRPQTFYYFQENPLSYLSFCEIQGGNIAAKKSHVTDVILKLWVSCALDNECIDPPGASIDCDETPPLEFTPNDVGLCHRYDQSVINIILRRLYQNKVPSVNLPNWLSLNGGENINYFPNTWKNWFHF